MTELERRALMGDQEAQRECTEKGIVLACPFCSGDFDAKFNGVMFKMERTNLYAHKRTGRCVLDGMIIFNLSDWNTRPAPPIRRCGECKFYTMLGHCKVHSAEPDQCGCGHFVEMLPTDFCSCFEPKRNDER